VLASSAGQRPRRPPTPRSAPLNLGAQWLFFPMSAICYGELTIFDFLAFQNEFDAGCE
jgi:hypothetical protein